MDESSPPPRAAATIRDVAKRAGVAISTISHVFSGARPISAKTRRKVLEAAAELAYRPNAIAQSMRRGDTGIVGLVLRPRDAVAGSLRGTETFQRLMGAIAANVLESGRALVLVPDLLSPSRREVPMDGCIVTHPYGDDEVVTHLMKYQTPFVTIDPDPNRPELPWMVRTDYAAPMESLLNRLYESGARNILLLSGTEDNAWNRYTAETYEAWAARRNLPFRHMKLYEGQASKGAYEIIDRELRRACAPDAVIAAASTFAAGALKAIRENGLDVPGDIRIAALTDSEYTRNATPGITAMDLCLDEAAGKAVALLASRLAGRQPPDAAPTVIPVLTWRGSTA